MTFQVVVAEIDFDDFESALAVPIHIVVAPRAGVKNAPSWLGTMNLPMLW